MRKINRTTKFLRILTVNFSSCFLSSLTVVVLKHEFLTNRSCNFTTEIYSVVTLTVHRMIGLKIWSCFHFLSFLFIALFHLLINVLHNLLIIITVNNPRFVKFLREKTYQLVHFAKKFNRD